MVLIRTEELSEESACLNATQATQYIDSRKEVPLGESRQGSNNCPGIIKTLWMLIQMAFDPKTVKCSLLFNEISSRPKFVKIPAAMWLKGMECQRNAS